MKSEKRSRRRSSWILKNKNMKKNMKNETKKKKKRA